VSTWKYESGFFRDVEIAFFHGPVVQDIPASYNPHTKVRGKEFLWIELRLPVSLLFANLLLVPAVVLQPLVDVEVRSVGCPA
jgi:hypothetical protein